MEKKLYRSRTKKVIAGIGGGLGDYIGVDPVIIRILLILFTILSGFGILVYIILWVVIQEEPYDNSIINGTQNNSQNISSNNPEINSTGISQENNANQQNKIIPESSNKGRVIFGAILIGVGLMFLSDRFIPSFDFEVLFMTAIILLGLFLIFNSTNKTEKKL
ncbi:MAG: PspC domain-containing protein [Ignavibacteriae bacterium]|nr:PspC domain-containing protein [Ignavibacteriota bacterium]